ncbi:MAG: hypothetical protein BIFFINMI_00785 [Phycisphaerae bacterium]|nr:hypothetical protein [Phycisphaerae bacterium]
MARFACIGLISLAVCLPALGAPPAKPATWREQPLNDELVDQTIQRALEYLWKARNADGNWESLTEAEYARQIKDVKISDQPNNPATQYGGRTALVLLAMLKCGVSPEDPRFDKPLKWLADLRLERTYARGLRAALLSNLGRSGEGYRRVMEDDKEWLLAAMHSDGTYGYWKPRNQRAPAKPPSGPATFSKETTATMFSDLSNTQYGILGVWQLNDAGIEIPQKYWQYVQHGYLSLQHKDGGWSYSGGRPDDVSYQSMTLGGLASLFIVWDKYYAANCDRQPDANLVRSVDRGLDWLGRNFYPAANTGRPDPRWFVLYTLYGVERVGVASGLKYFGVHNWWDESARYILRAQQADGSWPAAHTEAPAPVSTAWALLFLSYGRAPVIFNKLAYGDVSQWNSRPRDLARLTTWMHKTYEQLFNWQIMPIGRPVSELLEAPILLMSGQNHFELDAEQKEKLRQYILGGGLLLGEAAGGSHNFTVDFYKLVHDLFPDLELTPLPADHPLYTVQYQLGEQANALPKLVALTNGIRILVLFSPSDLGCTWQRHDINRGLPIFQLGGNLMQYVSDRGTGLVGRGGSYMVADKGNKPAASVTIGRLMWGSRWQCDPEPNAWRRVDVVCRNANLASVAAQETDLAQPLDAKAVPILHVTGVGPLTLNDAQKANLRKYVADGGLLLADAAGGGDEFVNSFSKVVAEFVGQPVPLIPPFADQVGEGGKVRMRHMDKLPRVTRPLNVLGCRTSDGKWQVLLVPCDLTAALAGFPSLQASGLTTESADSFIAALLKWRGLQAN